MIIRVLVQVYFMGQVQAVVRRKRVMKFFSLGLEEDLTGVVLEDVQLEDQVLLQGGSVGQMNIGEQMTSEVAAEMNTEDRILE